MWGAGKGGVDTFHKICICSRRGHRNMATHMQSVALAFEQ